jgi:hypothetical protein
MFEDMMATQTEYCCRLENEAAWKGIDFLEGPVAG